MSKRSGETFPPSKKKKTDLTSKTGWPPSFVELDKIHFRLNSYFTFLSSRKHVITTFDLLKSAPEAVIGRSLTHLDVSKIGILIPNDIVFKYVDENLLLLDQPSSTAQPVDVFELKPVETEAKQLLVFEFIDGDLKKSRTQLDLRLAEIRVPTYTPESMKALIARRDQKFVKVINQYLLYCEQKQINDPMQHLTIRAERKLPKPKVYVDPIQEMLSSVNNNVLEDSTRPYISDLLETLQQQDFYHGQMVPNGHFVTEPNPAIYEPLSFTLSPEICAALAKVKGIAEFYSHQAEAINALHDGKNVIVSTSTSSGKSLIYQLPVLCELETNPHATAMYIFPTKALAQDQKRSLKELVGCMPSLAHVVVETYDGDTDKLSRGGIRNTAQVIFTNPDMLHNSILPSHQYWRRFLTHLRYVVIDELHMYKDLFGSNVALIMRRLRRLCHSLQNFSVQFVSCSATLKNPVLHMAAVFGVDATEIVHISEDGSPSGEKHLVVWNPPHMSPNDHLSGRVSFIAESAKVLVELITHNVRTIAFCVVRKVCELLMKEVRNLLRQKDRLDLVNQVMSYRGGYSTSDRRQIETEMFKGNLKAVIATNALELGIDIGGLDAALICGFPLSTAKFRQQSGRAGRRNRDSLTLVVGSDDPVNQHYMAHPAELITQEYQDLVLDFDNMLVLEGHVQCGAFELPIDLERDSAYFGDKLEYICSRRLNKDHHGYHCHGRFLPWPPKHVSIRAIEEEHYAVVDITNARNVVIEEIEASRTSFTLYEGGIFIHQGYPYLIREFNTEDRFAKVERVDVEWHTSHRSYTDINPIEIEFIRSLGGPSDVPVYYGKIQTTIVVFGFFKFDKQKRILDAVEVHSPPVVLDSKGFWIDIPLRALNFIRDKTLNVAGGIHAAQHAIISMLPLFIAGGSYEIGTECKAPEKEFSKKDHVRKRPARLVFHDAKGGKHGTGLSAKAFEHIDEILDQALKRVEECPCETGCIECVATPYCKENSLVLSKLGALIILYVITGREFDLASIPDGPEANLPDIPCETIAPVEGLVKFSKEVEIIDAHKAMNPLRMVPKLEDIEMKIPVKEEAEDVIVADNEEDDEEWMQDDDILALLRQ
ncbi:hypothetical protein BABINDRAFT_170429 [Babjeviella inositovora NRRL Y-12698]|uniref:RNA helicase n=1 Tax=Babjeviella inositovora NRRL Y-12698 TaxID=984486 RepID=A0A1E3QVU8_9ASCO|nr:uncharacterized protein BABINDRAFT_170429 [Babjeviella inositovora NRRL Y-12698]ODQ81778.1 hypothetical protein BABINDRAFT_170429 [Babjeviella inositovora NRRL Y-12698]